MSSASATTASRAPFPAHESGRGHFALNPASVIVTCVIALTFIGLPSLFSATASFKQGPYFWLTKQLIGVCMAGGLAWAVSRVDLESMRRYVWIIGIVAAVLLVAVLIPHVGISVKGSSRWLGIGALRLQVSELAKLAMVFCLAHYLAVNQTKLGDLKRGYLIPLAMIGGFAGLIILEPDFGTAALTLSIGLILLFLAGARWRYILPTVGLAVAAFTVLVINNPNRLRRFMAFLDVEGNKQSGTYQLYQSLAAFAVGGVDGAGLGQGRQQINFLPEAHTDFIFAVVGEELGMIFTLGVVGLFITIFIAGLVHLRRAPNMFQFLLVTGCILLMSLQAIVNLGVVTGIFPTKGMSLPFISAGLSNLLLMGLLVGIIVNTQRSWPRSTLSRKRRAMQEVTGT
jgi:cell division protein FtsW